MKRIFILIGVLLLAVAGVSYLYFSSLRNRSVAGYAQISEAIPSDAVFAYSFTNEKEYDEIFRSESLFASVTGHRVMDEFRQAKNLIAEKPALKQAFNGQTIFLSLHADTLANKLNWLIITSEPKYPGWSELENNVAKTGKINEVQVNGGAVQSLTSRGWKAPVYFVRHKGLVAIAFSPAVLSGFLTKSDESPFIQLPDQQNRTALAGLMVNYRMLPKFASIINRKRSDRIFSLFPDMAGSSATTITYNKDALLFNGFTRLTPKPGAFAGLLFGQQPVRLSIDRILPDETVAYTAVGLSNYRRFLSRLDSAGRTSEAGKRKKNLQNQVSFPLNALIQQQFGGEYALALMPNTEPLAFVKIRNGLRLKQFLVSMSENGGEDDINRFRFEGFPEAYFGPLFRTLRRPYFAVVDEYLVMGNSFSTLSRYLQRRQNMHMLASDEAYGRHRKFMADRGNLNWFVSLKAGKNLLRRQLTEEAYAFFAADRQPGPADFDSFSLQLSTNGGEFYTNLCLKTGTSANDQNETLWTYDMSSGLATQPQIFNGKNGPVIVFQDGANRLHAVTDSGKNIFKVQLGGRIKGDIQTLEDDLVFAAGSKLYRINMEGNDAAGFPVSLSNPASAEISIFNGLLIVPMGNRIGAYDANGMEQPSWQNTVKGTIRFAMKEADFSSKKILVVLTDAGNVYQYSPAGAELQSNSLRPGCAFPFSYALQAGNDERTTSLITATRDGEIYEMNLNGETKRDTVGVFTGEVSFTAANISGDEKPELIFLDKRQLTVYTGNRIQAYNYLFTKPVKASIRIIGDRQANRIGIKALSGSELFLFNDDGSLVKGFPFKGSMPFWAGDLSGNGQKIILTASGGMLKAYAL